MLEVINKLVNQKSLSSVFYVISLQLCNYVLCNYILVLLKF